MRFYGASDDDIEEFRTANAPDSFEVEPENWGVLDFFCKLLTQWKRSPMSGVPEGLDYVAVEALARILKVDLAAPFMDSLQVLELSFIRESLRKAETRWQNKSR